MKNMFAFVVAAAALGFAVPCWSQADAAPEPVGEEAAALAPVAAAEPAPALVPEKKPEQRQKLSINLDKLAESQLEFLDKQFDTATAESLPYLLSEVNAWLSINSDKKNADKALELQAQVQAKMGDFKSAMLTYIKHIYSYPHSTVNLTVRSQLSTLVDSKLDRKLKQSVNTVAKGSAESKKSDRLASMLERMSEEPAAYFYEPLVREFVAFSADYPDYPRADVLQRALASVFLAKEQPNTAVLAYEQLLAVYPESSLKASVRMDIAAVLADKLKNYDKAIEIYQDVTNEHPGTPEAGQSYIQIGKLSELRKKYDLAISVYDKIIALYPKTDNAFNAFQSKAVLQRKQLALFGEAVDTLNAQADMFKGDVRCVPGLLLAAEIAQKDLKDFLRAANALDRIATEDPTAKEAPKALLDEGAMYEEHLGNKDKAKEIYERIIGSYAGNSLVKTAQKRIESMSKQ